MPDQSARRFVVESAVGAGPHRYGQRRYPHHPHPRNQFRSRSPRENPMIQFLQPEWGCGCWHCCLSCCCGEDGKGSVAAVEYSNIGVAQTVAREHAKPRGTPWVWLLPVLASAFLVVEGMARPQLAHGRTQVSASGIDIMLGPWMYQVPCRPWILGWAANGSIVLEVVKSVVSTNSSMNGPTIALASLSIAGAPYLISPLTLDHVWLQQNLERVSVGGARRWDCNRLRHCGRA